MDRRTSLKLMGGALAAGAFAPRLTAYAATPKTMVTVVKEAGVPWFNILNQGLEEAGKAFNITTSMTGPAQVDPAQQVKLIDDLIAKKVDIIGLVPLDVKVTGQALQRARDAGIIVITQEGPNQDGKTWDLELISAQKYGEMQMQSLAREMGEEGVPLRGHLGNRDGERRPRRRRDGALGRAAGARRDRGTSAALRRHHRATAALVLGDQGQRRARL